MTASISRVIRALLSLGILVLVAIQFVPYGRNHSNPPVTGRPAWNSAQTEQLARRACFDCHSHETRWPWYSHVAPISWRVQRHVEEGREHFNLSAFDKPQEDAKEAAEMVAEGKMPLRDYALGHPEARLSPEEKVQLIAGLRATFGQSSDASSRRHDHDEGADDNGED